MNDQEKLDRLKRLIAALECLRADDPAASIYRMLIPLLVARNPEVEIDDMAAELDLERSVVSRNLTLLAQYGNPKKPPKNLLKSEENPKHRRKRMFTLTKKGRTLIDNVLTILYSEDPVISEPTKKGENK